MSDFTAIYNQAAERRIQRLDFVGKERRQILQDAQKKIDLDLKNKNFLSRIEDIDDIKKLG